MKDKCLKTYTIIGVFFVLAAGSLAHFLYDWTGSNAIAGLFVPVNESVWEHMKLLFFPMLLYSAFGAWIYRRQIRCIVSALCLGITAGTLLIPVFFYAYTFILGRNIFLLDIGTFVLSTVIAFRLAFQLAVSCRAKPYILLSCVMVGVLFACFLWFTNHPPDIGLFSAYAPSDFALPC
ncbi:hypothetical protein D7X48_03410 [bacterium D16-50]|nr:hypothetical protein D7X48_03410 [bacterium D16-50]